MKKTNLNLVKTSLATALIAFLPSVGITSNYSDKDDGFQNIMMFNNNDIIIDKENDSDRAKKKRKHNSGDHDSDSDGHGNDHDKGHDE